jgi:hypothetical protein
VADPGISERGTIKVRGVLGCLETPSGSMVGVLETDEFLHAKDVFWGKFMKMNI